MIKNLLSKIPLEKVMAFAMRFGLLQKPIETVVDGWKKAKGVRSQGCVIVGAAMVLAGAVGWVPWEAALPIISLCAGAAGPAMTEKWDSVKDKVVAASKAIEAKAAETPDKP